MLLVTSADLCRFLRQFEKYPLPHVKKYSK